MNENKETIGFSGLKVISFESRRAFEMKSLIERNGGIAMIAPSMREIPFEINQEAIEFAKKIMEDKDDIVVLMTGVGTRFLFQIIEKQFPLQDFLRHFSKKTIVARGPKPVLALKEKNLTPTILVPSPNTWREILTELDKKGSIKNKRVFVQEYGIQRAEFIAELKKRGAYVSRVPVYRWALPEDLGPLRRAIVEMCDGHADILLFTNATQIHHVLQVAAEEGLESSFREAMDRVVVASIGPVASENLTECGLPVDFESQESKMGLFVKESSEQCPALLQQKRSHWKERQGKIEIKTYPAASYNSNACMDSPFMKACRKEPVPYTPVWLMRQAGRYMKEYRDLRSKVSFLDLCKNPDLACEVTVTAQERLDADAAIIFSDILLILEPMGVGLEYTKGEGPYIHRPVRTPEDVEHLRPADVKNNLSFVFEAIRKTRSALKLDVPLIGFAGAPFTLVSYMVEGGSAKNYLHVKNLMYKHPETWHALMDKVVESLVEYVAAQMHAGAQAIQFFDSWIGCLSPGDYRQYVFPHMKRLFSMVQSAGPAGIPIIHFGTGTASLLELMRDAGGTVIGLDWRVNLDEAWNRLGNTAVQGNLDPVVLLADLKTIREKVKEILDQAQGRPGHIFNLGHGILPQTPVENVIALVKIVKEMSTKNK